MTASFLWKIHGWEHKKIFEKNVCAWRVNAMKIFPKALNGLRCVRNLIKEHWLETLGWFERVKTNPKP